MDIWHNLGELISLTGIPILILYCLVTWVLVLLPFRKRLQKAPDTLVKLNLWLLFLFSPLILIAIVIIGILSIILLFTITIVCLLLIIPLSPVIIIYLFHDEIYAWLKHHIGPRGERIFTRIEKFPQPQQKRFQDILANLREGVLTFFTSRRMLSSLTFHGVQGFLSALGVTTRLLPQLSSIVINEECSLAVRRRAIQSLVRHRAFNELLAILHKNDLEPTVALRIAAQVALHGARTQAAEVWRWLTRHQDSRLRLHASRRLYRYNVSTAGVLLNKIAEDPEQSPPLRIGAAVYLARRGRFNQVSQVLEHFAKHYTQAEIALPAAVACGQQSQASLARSVIFSFLDASRTPEEHHAAIHALEKLRWTHELTAISRNHTMRPEDWLQVAQALYHLGFPSRAIITLLRLIKHQDANPEVRITGLEFLSSMNLAVARLSPTSQERVRDFLFHMGTSTTTPETICFAIAHTLKDLGYLPLSYEVLRILSSRKRGDPGVRRQATQASRQASLS